MDDTHTPTETRSRYVTRSVSLFPEQDATVSAFAKDSGIENYSVALRMIINEWLRMKTDELQRTK